MTFHGHIPIVSYHIDAPLLNSAGWKVPLARIPDVGFGDLFRIDEKDAITKLHHFVLQRNHPFEQHHPVSGQADGYDMKPPGLGEKITPFPAEIESPVMIGGLHAPPSDRERDADLSEEQIGRKSDEADPNQVLASQGGKEELTDSLLHFCIIKPGVSIGQPLPVIDPGGGWI